MDLSKLSDAELAQLWHDAQTQQQRGQMTHTASSGTELPDPNLMNLPIVGQTAHAALIGSGRTLDKVAEGNFQLMQNANIAAREAMGMPTGDQFQALNRQAAMEKAKDESYSGLRKQFPISTGFGEAGPLAPTPVGQASTAMRIAVPAIAYGLAGAAEYGSPKERLTRGGVNALSGLAGGGAGEIISRFAQPFRSSMNSAAQGAAQQAAAKIKAPLLPSQLTGNQTLARIEDSLGRAPVSADVIGDVVKQQNEAMQNAASSAMRGTDTTKAGIDAAKADMGAQYDKFRAAIPNGLPAQQPIFDSIDAAVKSLSAGSKTANGKGEAIDLLKQLKDELYASKALSPEDYSGWVSDLSTMARNAKNDKVGAALKSVGATMDKEARGPLNKDWQALDRSYSAAKAVEKSRAFNPQTGDLQYPSKLTNYMETRKSGANGTELQDVADFIRAVPQLRAGSPTFERGEVGMGGLLNALWRYPLAKALTSEGTKDYITKGLFASPEASRRAALLGQSGSLPLVISPINLGLLNFLSQ